MPIIGTFDPVKDIPSLAGKVILITGANTGLGKQSSLELAKHGPSHIWMTARDVEKGNAAVAEAKRQSPDVSLSFLELDLASFKSIKAAAKAFLATASRLDILFLNAGILGHPAAPTQDGYEIHIGTNHMGHALLLKLLVPLLVATASDPPGADVRVISLTSTGYKRVKSEDFSFDTFKDTVDGTSPIDRYCQSKLANLLYAQEVAKHFPQLTTVSVHPGEIATELFSREPGDDLIRKLQTEVAPKVTIPVEEGVKNQLWAATAKGLINGSYYEPIGVSDVVIGLAKDRALASRLWEWTEKELQAHDV